jgi:hypothetical protein
MGAIFVIIYLVNLILFWILLSLVYKQLKKTSWHKFTNFFHTIALITKVVLTFLLLMVVPLGLAIDDQTIFSMLNISITDWVSIAYNFLLFDCAIFGMYFILFLRVVSSAVCACKRITKDETLGNIILLLMVAALVAGIVLFALQDLNPDFSLWGLLLCTVGILSLGWAIASGWEEAKADAAMLE